jgi:fructose/tagatose bisphosphate aldolase
MAHLGGISVEGELGVLGSLESAMGEKPKTATAPRASSAMTSC